MGIGDFFDIRTSRGTIGDLGIEVPLSDLKDASICIDASYIIYSSMLAMRHINTLTDKEGKPTGHLTIIMNKVMQLAKLNVRQLWIFDSPVPNPLKEKTLRARAEKRKKSTDEKVQFKITGEIVGEVQELLNAMGISYLVSPPGVEAEKYGALLTRGTERERYCRFMLSGDSDVLAFGGNLLRPTKSKTSTGGKGGTKYYRFEYDHVLQALELSAEQFIDACLLMGTDFNAKMPRVGPATLLKKIKSGYELNAEMEEAKAYFTSGIDSESQVMREGEYQPDRLREILSSRAFSDKTIDKTIENMNSYFNIHEDL